jgi:hypothetical protein
MLVRDRHEPCEERIWAASATLQAVGVDRHDYRPCGDDDGGGNHRKKRYRSRFW